MMVYGLLTSWLEVLAPSSLSLLWKFFFFISLFIIYIQQLTFDTHASGSKVLGD